MISSFVPDLKDLKLIELWKTSEKQVFQYFHSGSKYIVLKNTLERPCSVSQERQIMELYRLRRSVQNYLIVFICYRW